MGAWDVEESDIFPLLKAKMLLEIYIASLLSIQLSGWLLFKSMFYRIDITKWTIWDVRKNVGCKPGMGTTFSPWCINQARASCPGVQSCFFANNATRSKRTLFFSKFSLSNRGYHAWQQDIRHTPNCMLKTSRVLHQPTPEIFTQSSQLERNPTYNSIVSLLHSFAAEKPTPERAVRNNSNPKLPASIPGQIPRLHIQKVTRLNCTRDGHSLIEHTSGAWQGAVAFGS